MQRLAPYIVFFLFISFTSVSQVHVVKPVKKTRPKSTNIAIGAGITNSQVFLTQNVKEHNSAMGFNGSVLYGGPNNNIRGCIEYTRYNTINIAPTWYNIKSNTIEANLHVLFKFKPIKAYFYTISGFSYNMFSGYFTGQNDFLHLRSIYSLNAVATKRWLAFNAGLGTEFFFKRFSIYGETKWRIGTAEGNKQLTIMDLCYFAGVRYNLRVPSIYSLFRGTRSRYVLDKESIR